MILQSRLVSVARARIFVSSRFITTKPQVIAGRHLLPSLQHVRKVHFTQCTMSESTSGSSSDNQNPKLVPNEEWAQRLTPESYFCAREGGTEPPFSGKYYKNKDEGLYLCVCCGAELFSSKAKYDSGSGWPSFQAAVHDAGSDLASTSDSGDTGVLRRKDISHGMVRVEVICQGCNAHLGHVFDDGPQPSGERFCINSACLKFQPKKLS